MKSMMALALSLVVLVSGALSLQMAPAQATDAQQTATPQPTSAQAVPPTLEITPPKAAYQLTGLPTDNTAWRPVAVSTSSSAARVRGIGKASVVYEVLAQGHETSLSLLFNNVWEMPMTGPIVQANDILWQMALPQNAVLVQKGWNTYAENLLNCYAYQPIDAMIEGTNTFLYDNGGDATRAPEDCWMTDGIASFLALETYGISAEGESGNLFQFGENTTGTPGATKLWVQYDYPTGSLFTYQPESELWLYETVAQGAVMDADTQTQVAFDNVFLLQAQASVKDDGYTREYDLTEGTGLYLTKGTWQDITWYKGDVGNTVVLYDQTGAELVVNPGKSYVGIYGGFDGQMLNLVTE